MPSCQKSSTRWVSWLLLTLFVSAAPLVAAAESFRIPTQSADPVRSQFFARVQGRTIQAVIKVRIGKGWHLYHTEKGTEDGVGRTLKIAMLGNGIAWGIPRLPKPHKTEQDGVGKGGRDTWIFSHKGTILIYVLGTLADGADGHDAGVTLTGQTCSDNGECIPYGPDTLRMATPPPAVIFAKFPTDLAASAGAASSTKTTGESKTSTPTHTPSARHDDAYYDAVSFADLTVEPQTGSSDAGHGILVWLFLAFLAGAILNIMPCVLPVISIKVLSFVQQAGEDRKRVLRLGLSFAAGILFVFIILGALAAGAIQGMNYQWGQQFESDAFKIVLVCVLFAFALSMFGVFELEVPRSVGNLAAGPRKEGLADAFSKGILATLLATPCSGPLLAEALAWATGQDNPATVFFIFLVMGLGMAAPYVVLTTHPAFLKFVPKPGAWMEGFKQGMGFLLIGSLLFFMFSIKENLILTNVMLAFIAFACWLWGRYGVFGKPLWQRWGILLAAGLMIVVGSYVSYTLLKPNAPDGWEEFDYEKFNTYRQAKRSIMIDFTADWCVNCLTNEKRVYNHKVIREIMRRKNIVMFRADLTTASARTKMLKRLRGKLGGNAIPFVAIFPGDQLAKPHVRSALVSFDDIKKLLEDCP